MPDQITPSWYTSGDPGAIAFREWVIEQFTKCYIKILCTKRVTEDRKFYEGTEREFTSTTFPNYPDIFHDSMLASNLKLIEAKGCIFEAVFDGEVFGVSGKIKYKYRLWNANNRNDGQHSISALKKIEAETPTLAAAQALYKIYLQEKG
jgi:hypothetical protein